MSAAAGIGERDLERSAVELAARLPEPLAALARLAYNYRWSWYPGGEALFRAVDPHRWALCGHNPVRLLQEASIAGLSAAAADSSLCARASELEGVLQEELAAPASEGFTEPHRPIAFLCAEHGIHPSLPIYSGGLGVLAGDFLKEASDRRLPLVAVGLMYREGYFRQRIDAAGGQHEYWVETDPRRVPAALVTGADGAPLTVSVPIRAGQVTVQIWRVDVGRVPLFLLDAERSAEQPDRPLDHGAALQLGDRARALPSMRCSASAACVRSPRWGSHRGSSTSTRAMRPSRSSRLVRSELDGRAGPRAGVRGRPVADRLHDAHPGRGGQRHLPGRGCDRGARRVRVGDRSRPRGSGPRSAARTLTTAASRSASRSSRCAPPRAANGVSRAPRRGGARDVARAVAGAARRGRADRSRDQRRAPADLDRRADAAAARAVTSARAGGARRSGDLGRRSTRSPTRSCGRRDREQRASLIAFARDRSVEDRLGRDEPRDYVDAADDTFDPGHLTIGFARRLATYKRLHLLLLDMRRALATAPRARARSSSFSRARRTRATTTPSASCSDLFDAKYADHVGQRVVYLDDYDLAVAERLVAGLRRVGQPARVRRSRRAARAA